MPGIVVADTGPLQYLILTDHIDLLARLFGGVSIPTAVVDELRHANSPPVVRDWIACPPRWLAVHPDPADPAPALGRLDPGERAVIALAHALGAGLLLIDDRAAIAVARERGFRATGTLGVLVEAASEGLLDLVAALAALRATNFPLHAAVA